MTASNIQLQDRASLFTRTTTSYTHTGASQNYVSPDTKTRNELITHPKHTKRRNKLTCKRHKKKKWTNTLRRSAARGQQHNKSLLKPACLYMYIYTKGREREGQWRLHLHIYTVQMGGFTNSVLAYGYWVWDLTPIWNSLITGHKADTHTHTL